MIEPKRLSRRAALALSAGAAVLPLCHIRTAGAAGKLAVAFTSSFVPGSDETVRKLVATWGEKNNVEVGVDFLNFVSNQVDLTHEAEAQARAGHDVLDFYDYYVAAYEEKLEPVDDVVGGLVARNGPLTPGIDHFAKLEGTWRAVPIGIQSIYCPTESRIDLFHRHVGLDVVFMFSAASEMGPDYDHWTWDAFLIAAERCFKAGYPFGLAISNCEDSNIWLSALFRSFGANLIDAKGDITVKSDAIREVLDYANRLGSFLQPDVYAWDNASNNRAMISGKSALIFNPPSAWAGAIKDNPSVGEQIWHHPMPAGKHGRYTPFSPNFLGIWSFSRNKSAAKDLIAWLGQREQVEAACLASRGYDVPPFASMMDFPIWAEAGPPKGTLFNYPLRPAHHAMASAPGAPAPPVIAQLIQVQWVMPKMLARVMQRGISIETSIALAEQELEGLMR